LLSVRSPRICGGSTAVRCDELRASKIRSSASIVRQALSQLPM
jgi:hypothetical protein